ncbi:MAG TPA: DegT/DnrJ/EryC1/StrS family aminotransferase [Bacteroidales bacterium]|nr:aminotransferase class I/II-fold pyridoxal phosphate-dependent enzyme [Bacteroidales bacterium]HNR42456.1 DegT/DnrJ/EryC1/StrS family aminotransferase [Bacteroidales bacterium]HPV15905.1 DegT/DnrJ/EryC1/StrS family aminotransferase [Bacteroidales bacterium]HQG78120.1 DegT/DnrJ/EryC1/StrS family aminotransferase [Bacteroidales bacterium]
MKRPVNLSRREFVKKNSLAGIGAAVALSAGPTILAECSADAGVPAVLGGEKIRTKPWPSWPEWDQAADEELVLKTLRSGIWSRAKVVEEFERKWAETIGSKRCLAVVNGTNSLITALVQAGIGGGDEVIIPPYTFIATAIAVLQTGAIPVFVDTDPETYQIDARKIEAKITPRTRAIMPVHLFGFPADMTRIMAIAKKHNLIVIEDACQAWLAEINHKKVGTFGLAGCFSFQNSKNIPIGECGAIVSDDDEYMDRCYSYHNYGNPYGTVIGEVGAGTVMAGTKLRITEYQAAIGLAQLKRLDAQTTIRHKSAEYLKSRIGRIPGILTYKLNPGVTRVSYHIFPFRYRKQEFRGLSREQFIRALEAEGIPSWGGYTPLNKMPYLKNAFLSKNFKLMYQPEMLDYDKYMERNQCPLNDQLCEEAVWLMQNILLGDRSDMDDIANAIERIHKNAEKIKNALS